MLVMKPFTAERETGTSALEVSELDLKLSVKKSEVKVFTIEL